MVVKDEYINYASGFYLTDRIPMGMLYLGDLKPLYDFIEEHTSSLYEYVAPEALYAHIHDTAEYLQESVDIKPEYLA